MKNKVFRSMLQLFAEGDNNDLSARSYQKEFKELLQAVFRKQSYFADFFGGELEALDGVRDNETAFYVKTSDIPVAVGDGYKKDTNTAFGSGTSSSNRFGERTEVIYTDIPVEYTWGWNFHEGIDRHTVNHEFDSAVADRLELQSRAKTAKFNAKHGKFISDSAKKTLELENYTSDGVLKLFDELSAYFNNIEAVGTKVAKVNSSLYNAIVNHPLTTTSKNSAASVAENEVFRFKGFSIQEVPDGLFQEKECCYAYIAGIAKAFTGTAIRLLDTLRPKYTFDNMASDEFMIADTENTPILGGKARMSFGDALKLVKRGMGMRLPNWKPDVVIRAQFPDENSKMTAPYLYVESRFGRVPWKETMIELFSEEWEVVD